MNNKHQLTAVIYDKKGNILSIGQNSYIKTHPLMYKHAKKVNEPHRIYLHAEVHAITRCKDIGKAHRIFVSRYNKAGLPVLAKPCPVCISAIEAAGIKEIIHT